jgi:hypothetical protein
LFRVCKKIKKRAKCVKKKEDDDEEESSFDTGDTF